jgi:hypothetical protein
MAQIKNTRFFVMSSLGLFAIPGGSPYVNNFVRNFAFTMSQGGVHPGVMLADEDMHKFCQIVWSSELTSMRYA